MAFDFDKYMAAAFGISGWDERRLLHAFVYASVSVIQECSGSISEDCKKLRAWADRCAEADLGVEPIDFDWDIYIHEEDEG